VFLRARRDSTAGIRRFASGEDEDRKVVGSIVDALIRTFNECILALHPCTAAADKLIVSPVIFPRCK
jgi:hypothetical protein